ncbi:histidine kinase dimerization/phosphoacceptor domain -containing protein [Phenylobacterium sp.]|jgi:PAS domain S-box-containing protein|uniref:histidine kinase dimerization/phosphoacceptor domain -containing protein n=1 Tax=Phenylobacterium sp. TaxID=1871053 RepID=UPI002E30ABD7|nr:histidine kinase dimerization/phosphoacceptor domain -containing protein [Phenylobacterium sp.]HEX2558577.1 histidine kinase dimerization/phosphoacceptor domain -containing protein [Phenylobacterium sp.]
MNEYEHLLEGTAARTAAEADHENIRQRGGIFVEAVRVTRMPMLVTDPKLPGNPITFANPAFLNLSGYTMDELLGQGPHFVNGTGTEPAAIAEYEAAMDAGRDATLEILQYRKDGSPFHAMLFATALTDGQGGVCNHFLSYLDISRRHDAEDQLRELTKELEQRVAARTEELEAAIAGLAEAAKEREMLLVEVNHRAKNSLAVAASLLLLQGRRQADAGINALFSESADRLAAMARVHDLLSRSESSQRVDLATYTAELCEALRPLTGGSRIVLRAKAEEDILVDADVAFPIGIVLTELITNAVKYAFPKGRSGTVIVQARRSGPGQVELVVRDNGIGMNDFREGSLGYGLIRALVKQIGGRIDIQGDAGVTVAISFSDASRSLVQ